MPDFGFEASIIDKGNQNGWSLFRDFVCNENKYERLENYVYASKQIKEQQNMKDKIKKFKE